MINGRGRGSDVIKGGQGCGIAAVETETEHEHVDEASGRGGRGGKNGVRFGRGGYRTLLLRSKKGEQATPSLAILGFTLLLFFLPFSKHTVKKRNISVISNRVIGKARRDTGDNNNTVQGHLARKKMDTHTDTCYAGANWTPMHYTGEICDVSPFLNNYAPSIAT